MRSFAFVVILALCGCGPQEEAAVEPTVVSRTDAVLGGKVSFADPEVFLMYMRYPGSSAICSSTLIGRRTLLTAAHCVAPENGSPPRISVTNHPNLDLAPDSAFIKATQSHPHPFYRSDVVGKYDVAAVELEREPPVPLKAWNTEGIDGLFRVQIRVVGYGLTDTESDDSGLRRTGLTQIQSVSSDQIDFGKEGANRSGTCSGDSGGPAFYTFPDGSERVIGVHSFHSGGCGNNTDMRVDRFQDQVRAWLDEFENGSCDADLRCQMNCVTPDPDCACLEDGQCNPGCSAPSADPDCAASCVADGVCSNTACTTPDPDCQPAGDFCGRPGHCASRLCITSPQHDDRPYCSQACSPGAACPTGLSCVAGQCEITPLPAAEVGAACTIGGTYCGGPEFRCASWAKDPQTRCVRSCYENADCNRGYSCAPSVEEPELGVCVQNVVVPKLGVQPLVASCASVPASLWVSLAALPFFLRRRRR